MTPILAKYKHGTFSLFYVNDFFFLDFCVAYWNIPHFKFTILSSLRSVKWKFENQSISAALVFDTVYFGFQFLDKGLQMLTTSLKILAVLVNVDEECFLTVIQF